MTNSNFSVEHSTKEHIKSITEIYAEEVLTGLASFEVVPPDTREMAARRDTILQRGHPYLVAMEKDEVNGYAYVGPYRTRTAYQHTLENSVYVAAKARGRGVGKMLLSELLNICERGSWRTVIAIIGDSNNTGSIALHKSLGFRHVGTIEAAGYKHDRWVDSVIMQKMLTTIVAKAPE